MHKYVLELIDNYTHDVYNINNKNSTKEDNLNISINLDNNLIL